MHFNTKARGQTLEELLIDGFSVCLGNEHGDAAVAGCLRRACDCLKLMVRCRVGRPNFEPKRKLIRAKANRDNGQRAEIANTRIMSDLPPSYDSAQSARPTINFPILTELHGKRVVLGTILISLVV